MIISDHVSIDISKHTVPEDCTCVVLCCCAMMMVFVVPAAAFDAVLTQGPHEPIFL